jgi:hypothetical protein
MVSGLSRHVRCFIEDSGLRTIRLRQIPRTRPPLSNLEANIRPKSNRKEAICSVPVCIERATGSSNFSKSSSCVGAVQPDQREGYDDPAVGAILALAAAQISAAEDWLCKIARSPRSPGQSGPGGRRRWPACPSPRTVSPDIGPGAPPR